MRGETLTATSGLVKALQGRGFKDVIEIECTGRRVPVKEFMLFPMDSYEARREAVAPESKCCTNDAGGAGLRAKRFKWVPVSAPGSVR